MEFRAEMNAVIVGQGRSDVGVGRGQVRWRAHAFRTDIGGSGVQIRRTAIPPAVSLAEVSVSGPSATPGGSETVLEWRRLFRFAASTRRATRRRVFLPAVAAAQYHTGPE